MDTLNFEFCGPMVESIRSVISVHVYVVVHDLDATRLVCCLVSSLQLPHHSSLNEERCRGQPTTIIFKSSSPQEMLKLPSFRNVLLSYLGHMTPACGVIRGGFLHINKLSLGVVTKPDSATSRDEYFTRLVTARLHACMQSERRPTRTYPLDCNPMSTSTSRSVLRPSSCVSSTVKYARVARRFIRAT